VTRDPAASNATAGSRPSLLGGADPNIAIVDAGTGDHLTYSQLAELVSERAEQLSPLAGNVVFLTATQTIPTIVDYLALLRVQATTAMLDQALPRNVVESWIAAYKPAAVLGFPGQPAAPFTCDPREPRPERLLLATSGSTGSPKFVRLSEHNVVANASQIAEALHLTPSERAIAHLPLFYSFGLSILNSHLAAGGSIVLSTASVIEPRFADDLRKHEVTSVSGVPFTFKLFDRCGLFDWDLPSLRHVTQAGGKLPVDRALAAHEKLSERGINLWLMYGQTEATARISVLPPEDLPAAAETAGYPIPGSRLTVDGPAPDGVDEIVYEGPNVMLGYATSADDLTGRDDLEGTLRTGDVGRLDGRGRVIVTGRSKRIAKVAGVRINLDDIERRLAPFGILAAIDAGSGIHVVLEESDREISKRDMERHLGLSPGAVRLSLIDALPRTSSGKTDYAALKVLR
jgi:acyl-coenzyme A synthetase/AMP-(fatty) acid ligase